MLFVILEFTGGIIHFCMSRMCVDGLWAPRQGKGAAAEPITGKLEPRGGLTGGAQFGFKITWTSCVLGWACDKRATTKHAIVSAMLDAWVQAQPYGIQRPLWLAFDRKLGRELSLKYGSFAQTQSSVHKSLLFFPVELLKHGGLIVLCISTCLWLIYGCKLVDLWRQVIWFFKWPTFTVVQVADARDTLSLKFNLLLTANYLSVALQP